MGQPVQGSVYRLFQGVSRQPDSLRLEGQVEEAVNVWMSVVSGGFEPRPGSELFCAIEGMTSTSVFLHTYRRDSDEEYLLWINDGVLRIFNSSGTQVYQRSDPYFDCPDPATQLKAVTAGDVTFICNRTISTSYSELLKPEGPDTASITCVKGDETYGKWSVTVTIGSSVYLGSASGTADTRSVITALRDTLSIPAATAEVTAVGSTLVIRNKTNNQMKITTSDFWGDEALITAHKRVDTTNDLPPSSVHGTVVAVSDGVEDFVWMEFVADDGYTGTGPTSGYWKESVKPGSKFQLDATTMPHTITNLAKDQFDSFLITWQERQCGEEGDIFEPEFVGSPIQDITFHRDRLILIAGESVDCSKQGDYYSFFPERSSEVLDTDPFSRTASSRRVNYLYNAVPFRSQLFLMSDNGQFELRGDPSLTPKTATLELATQYKAETLCDPVVMGSELYFASTIDQNVTTLFEYYFQEASVSHVATNASIQVEGYVPGPARRLVADSLTNTLFLLQEKEPNRIYIYKTFWDGTEKRQSSWSYWEFDFPISNMSMFKDRLLLVTQRGGNQVAFQIPLSNKSPLLTGLPSQYHLDFTLKAADVTVDLEAGITTATFPLPFVPNTEVYCVLAAGQDSIIVPGQVGSDGYTVTIETFSTVNYEVYAGYPFQSFVELSQLLPKDQEGRSITEGRTQLRRLSVEYKDSAQFDVRWANGSRSEKRSPFLSYEGTDVITLNTFPQLRSGTHEVKLRGRGDRLRIRIGSEQPYPYKITGIRWRGTYHDKYGG